MSKIRIGSLTVNVVLDALDVATIQAKTPVKTGQLRDGWKLDAEGNIVNETDYAAEVEFGTVNRPGAFMAHRSLPEMEARLAKRIAEQVNRPGLVILPEIRIKVGGN